MASLFGSVATEVGGTMKDLGQQKREERMVNEEAQREAQLEKQRMKHSSDLLGRRISADDRRETRRQEYDTKSAEFDATRASEEAEEKRSAEEAKYKFEGGIDLMLGAMATWNQQQKDGVGRGNGWTSYEQQSWDADGNPVTEFYAQRDGITYRQVDDKFVEAGSQTPMAQFESIDVQREAEDKLWKGDVTAQQFKDVFGYVPAAYVVGEIATGSDFGAFLKKNKIPMPNVDMSNVPDSGRRRGDRKGGSDSDRAKKIQEEGGTTEYPIQPSIEEMSDSPYRDEHRQFTRETPIPGDQAAGKSNAEIVDIMRAQAGGGTKLLSAGAAAEADPLTQGGNLEQPTATAATELDDAGAGEIASGISKAFQSIYGQSPVLQRFSEIAQPTEKGYRPNRGTAQ